MVCNATYLFGYRWGGALQMILAEPKPKTLVRDMIYHAKRMLVQEFPNNGKLFIGIQCRKVLWCYLNLLLSDRIGSVIVGFHN